MTRSLPLDRGAIEAIIPHRAPFLLVDVVTELDPGVRCRASWTIRGDEAFLGGHFPGNPIVPGVLLVESAAQAAAICALTHPSQEGKFGVFAGIDEVRFRRIVRPGDTLDIEIEVDRLRGRLGRVRAQVRIGDEPALTGVLTFALLDEAPA